MRRLRYITCGALAVSALLTASCLGTPTSYVYDRVTSQRNGKPTLVLVDSLDELKDPHARMRTVHVTQREYDNCPRGSEYPRCANATE